MAGHRLVVFLLALSTISGLACNRKQLRSDQSRISTPIPSALAKEMAAQPPITPPTPPLPPSTIQPPKPDALAGIVPPVPKSGQPVDMPPAEIADSPIVPVSGTDSATGGPIRDKIEELKRRIKDRKDDKKPVGLPSPFEPKTAPPTVPTLPPVPATPPATIPDSPKVVTQSDELNQAKQLLDAAVARYGQIPDFEARLVKQEVIGGKALPKEETIYRFRKQPLSVYSQVLSEAGQGREMMYVRGQFGDKMHIITGKGDNVLVGSGFKTDLDPDSKTASAKSRWKVYEAGFSRNLNSLSKAISASDARRQTVVWLGQTKRPEFAQELLAVEFSVRPGDEPHLPKGGLRKMFFDNKPDSPSYRLPVLVLTTDADGKEVEYYCFDKFKIPLGWTDADWNPARLGKK